MAMYPPFTEEKLPFVVLTDNGVLIPDPYLSETPPPLSRSFYCLWPAHHPIERKLYKYDSRARTPLERFSAISTLLTIIEMKYKIPATLMWGGQVFGFGSEACSSEAGEKRFLKGEKDRKMWYTVPSDITRAFQSGLMDGMMDYVASFHELDALQLAFKFPKPRFLKGVTTKGRDIVVLSNMSFQYPGTSKPQLQNINFQCSLGSRIAVIGAKGAGKSTLVNVLSGELNPTSGDPYKHDNIRIAHIKQHVFAHINNHLDKTPSEYIQWRFQGGEDRETAHRKITETDEKALDKIYRIEGTERRVVSIHSRRKLKNSYEYECSLTLGENVGLKDEKWIPMSSADNAWIARTELMESHPKMVTDFDRAESNQSRSILCDEIETHCGFFGLDSNLVSHSRMSGLTRIQLVTVCLAASTWLRPQLIVLDEPTTYLDYKTFAALRKALKRFRGGVIITAKSEELTDGLADEVWTLSGGSMSMAGQNSDTRESAKAAGNANVPVDRGLKA